MLVPTGKVALSSVSVVMRHAATKLALGKLINWAKMVWPSLSIIAADC